MRRPRVSPRLALALLVALPVLAHEKGKEPGATIAGKVSLLDKEGTRAADDAVVYIETADPALWKGEKKKGKETGELREIAMHEKKFLPRVVAVLAGEEVNFPNYDPVFHNVFSLSGKSKFDLGLYKDGKSKTKDFKEPGVVRVFCNIHPGMTAYVLVMQNPWFATTNADGAFKIKDVRPGTYTLHVWHERGGETTREIELTAGGKASADFELDARGFKALPHKNKLGQDYGGY